MKNLNRGEEEILELLSKIIDYKKISETLLAKNDGTYSISIENKITHTGNRVAEVVIIKDNFKQLKLTLEKNDQGHVCSRKIKESNLELRKNKTKEYATVRKDEKDNYESKINITLPVVVGFVDFYKSMDESERIKIISSDKTYVKNKEGILIDIEKPEYTYNTKEDELYILIREEKRSIPAAELITYLENLIRDLNQKYGNLEEIQEIIEEIKVKIKGIKFYKIKLKNVNEKIFNAVRIPKWTNFEESELLQVASFIEEYLSINNFGTAERCNTIFEKMTPEEKIYMKILLNKSN